MQQSLITLGMLAGGLGLFMLAVSMITDGLKAAAGHALRDMLGKWTRSHAHGVATGLLITAIVQSSSAVTVAIIGFVNAGLITMHKAIGIIYGSNIGTTITGWLVAIVGFKINVDAFDGLVATIDLNKFVVEGVAAVFIYMAIGFLMTVLTQSSSATIAITLTAATGGVLGIYAAAAMVIGANVGTTSTAAVAVIGATSNAKRVASAHIIFNIFTGVVALTMLPVLFWVVQNTTQLLGLEEIPAVTLALFHTTFNVFGVLLMFPFTRRMAIFLDKYLLLKRRLKVIHSI